MDETNEHDPNIIDLRRYLERDADPEERLAHFSVWGGEGERSRFSLPLWRAIYLVEGERAGIVWAPAGAEPPGEVHSHFVLDLGEEEPRTAFGADLIEEVWDRRPPAIVDADEVGTVIALGEKDEKRWFVLVDEVRAERPPLERRRREDLLFLAGEVAGLLMQRRLDRPHDVDDEEGYGPLPPSIRFPYEESWTKKPELEDGDDESE